MTTTAPAGARLVLATRNEHKLVELRDMLRAVPALTRPHVSGRGDRTVSLDQAVVGLSGFDLPEVVESGVSFEENALLKARAAARGTGLPALADDSGIVVDVLGAAPGVWSAGWAGRHGDDAANRRLLLAQLADVPDEHRQARFVCAMALVRTDGTEVVRVGQMRGTLAREESGGGGFGYDPIFVPSAHDGSGSTNAQLSPEQKNRISHRGAALGAIMNEVLVHLV